MPRATITAIERAGRTRARRVFLEGERWRTLPADVIAELELREGSEVDTAELEEAIETAEMSSARARALRLVAARERSSAEVRDRLQAEGYSASAADAVVATLGDSGLIDDDRHAEALARSLVEIRGLGRSRVARDLAARGVTEERAASVLETMCGRDREAERALSLARRLAPRVDGDASRLARRLVSRGFSTTISLEAARDAMSTLLPGETSSPS